MGELIAAAHKSGSDHRKYSAVIKALYGADELYCSTPALCICNIFKSEICDALAVHPVGIYVLAEDDRGKNAYLAAGIIALNIGCGIFLGIAQLLSHCKSVLKGHLLGYHLGEDKVCCTV